MKTVVLDAGHGGADSGGAAFGSTEKAIVLDHVLRVDRLLQNYHCNVLLTRRTDKFLTLTERRNFANAKGSDLFVSAHTNAFSKESANGYEAFTTPGATKSDRAASIWMRRQGNAFPDRTARTDTSDGDADKEANFAVLRCKGPAILLELGFITNLSDHDWMQDETTKATQAVVTCETIVEFLGLIRTKTDPVILPTPEEVFEHPRQDEILATLSRMKDLTATLEDLI